MYPSLEDSKTLLEKLVFFSTANAEKLIKTNNKHNNFFILPNPSKKL